MSFENELLPYRMNIGYARISTQDQNLDLQRQALERAGCDKIYEDIISGIRKQKPGLTLALEVLHARDALIVWKLDRLGRSVKRLVNLVGELEAKGIHFKSLTDDIDTSTPTGRFFFRVMASLAQMERELIIERTQAGLKAARLLGRKGGRKRLMTDSKLESVKKLLATGTFLKIVARDIGVSVAILHR